MEIARRALLQSPLALALPPSPDLIRRENAKPGADWQLTNIYTNSPKRFRTSLIEGYCSNQSVEAGDTLRIFVSVNPARRFSIDVFRLGYYGGAGARRITRLGPFRGKPQPDPTIGPNRLRECRWEPSTEITIPADWPSGVYLGRLECVAESPSEHGWQSYVVFVVRDRRRAGILFQVSDNTWAAYNRWPDDYSLYTDPRHPWAPGVAASFDRPYGKYAQIYDHPQSVGSGEFLLWEFPLAYWLEQHGYDVTYCSNSDMIDPDQFLRTKIFLSVGHDEYWDPRQYDGALASVRAGTTHLYLCGNAVMGVTPFQPSYDGRNNRILSREGVFGGIYGDFGSWFKEPFPTEGPKANKLIGAHSVYPFNSGGDWICSSPRHWMFDGTGMKQGDSIPGLVGWEFHGDPPTFPVSKWWPAAMPSAAASLLSNGRPPSIPAIAVTSSSTPPPSGGRKAFPPRPDTCCLGRTGCVLMGRIRAYNASREISSNAACEQCRQKGTDSRCIATSNSTSTALGRRPPDPV
ncbi:MAG: DUF6605 domain-containing protein [Bryobacteraceae bacterium]